MIAVARDDELADPGAAGALAASTRFLVDPMTRVGTKVLLNALSTCTMVRLGRVLGSRMIWVVPSNLKLTDRATRDVRDLAGVSCAEACHALFEALDCVEPRRSATLSASGRARDPAPARRSRLRGSGAPAADGRGPRR